MAGGHRGGVVSADQFGDALALAGRNHRLHLAAIGRECELRMMLIAASAALRIHGRVTTADGIDADLARLAGERDAAEVGT